MTDQATTHPAAPAAGGANPPLTVSVRDAVRLTGLGRSTLYRHMDAGRLPFTKLVGRRLIPHDALRALVTAAPAACPAPAAPTRAGRRGR